MGVDWSSVEWYSRSRTSIESGPSIAVTKAGRVVLNEAAMTLLAQMPEAFQVGVIQGAKGKTTLILQVAKKGDGGSLALAAQGKKHSLNTARFLKEKGLEKVFGTTYNKVEYDADHSSFIVIL